jgi:hypothetical protein
MTVFSCLSRTRPYQYVDLYTFSCRTPRQFRSYVPRDVLVAILQRGQDLGVLRTSYICGHATTSRRDVPCSVPSLVAGADPGSSLAPAVYMSRVLPPASSEHREHLVSPRLPQLCRVGARLRSASRREDGGDGRFLPAPTAQDQRLTETLPAPIPVLAALPRCGSSPTPPVAPLSATSQMDRRDRPDF